MSEQVKVVYQQFIKVVVRFVVADLDTSSNVPLKYCAADKHDTPTQSL